MKPLFLASLILMCGVGMSVMANAKEEVIKIRSLFNIKHSFCAIKTNEVLGMDNRNSAYEGRGGGISSTNALLFLENGENEISLEIGSLQWFSREDMDDSSRERFTPGSGCKLDLVIFGKNTENTTLASINVIADNNGTPELISDVVNNITHKEILAEQVTPGHINPKFFGERYFPNGMKLHKFSKKVIMTGIPGWEWISATPFIGSEDQIKNLQDAYLEIAGIINTHDRARLKKSHSIALSAWARATGEEEDNILLSQYSEQEIEGKKVNIDAIKWDDYAVRVMNKGRLVQFYNKSRPTYSPLTYHYKNEDGKNRMGYYAPMFSLIDGKFVVVI